MSLSRRGLLAVLALAGALSVSLSAGALAQVPGSTLSCTPASIQPGQSTTCTTAVAVPFYSTVGFASDLSGASAPPCNLALVGGVSFECSSTVTLTTAGTHHITSTANSIGGCIPVIPGICIPIGIGGPPLVSNPFTVIVGAASQVDQHSPLPPVVTGISPSSGTAGSPVVITGDHFETTKQVLFGSTPANIVTDGYRQISAVAPAGESGTVDVTVVNENGTSEKVSADRFTYSGRAPQATANTAGSPGVSQGTPVCPNVPSLIGKTYRGAKAAVKNAACAAVLFHTGHAAHGKSHVLAQTPVAGTPLYAGDRLGVTLG